MCEAIPCVDALMPLVKGVGDWGLSFLLWDGSELGWLRGGKGKSGYERVDTAVNVLFLSL